MNSTMTYGGWAAGDSFSTCSSFANQFGYQTDTESTATATNVSTDTLSGFVRWLGCMAVIGALTSIGTGGEPSFEYLQGNIRQARLLGPTVEVFDVASVRTPTENLARIREILKPSISALAATFGVSRQSVYNWLNGEPMTTENADRLQDLAQAADVLAHEGIVVNAALLRRKFASGQTLLQVAQAGGSAREAAQKFVRIHNREVAQREHMAARFAGRTETPPSGDFDLPLANDHA